MQTTRRFLVCCFLTLSSAIILVPSGVAQVVIATVPVGLHPLRAAVDPATNKTYVANLGDGTVTVIDGGALSTQTVTVGGDPHALGINPITNKIYVVNCNNNCGGNPTVTVIDGATLSTQTVGVGLNSTAVVVNSATNRIYVVNNCGSDPVCWSAGTVTAIDGATLSTQTIAVGYNPLSVAVDSVANRIYVVNNCGSDPFCQNTSDGTVTVIDGATLSTQTVIVGIRPLNVAVNSVTNAIYVANSSFNGNGTVTVIDGATLSTQTVKSGGAPDFVGINPVTNKIYVANCNSDCGGHPSVTVIDGATLSTTAVSVCSVSGEFPTDVEVDAVTNKVYVPCSYPGTVTVIDGATNSTTSVMVGNGASGAAVNSVTNRIYVPNYSSDTVSVIAGAVSGFYYLDVSADGTGTVTSTDGFLNCPGSCYYLYPVNTQVTLNATAAQGWTFTGWSGDCSGTGSCVVTMTQDLSVGATFTQNPVYYTLTVSTVGYGIVTSTDGFINCPGTCSHPYLSNTQVTLNATPGQGWAFGGWNGVCFGTGSCTVTMTQPLTVDAIFLQALQFVAVTPCRLVDTRSTGGPIQGNTSRDFAVPQLGGCNIPNTAAYSLNVTVVPHGPLGYLTIWPAGENQPYVSTLNSYDGRVKAVAAIIGAGNSGGAVSVYVTDTADVILDIDGYFAPISGSTLAFYPLAPCRVADTRGAPGDLGAPYLKGGVPRDFPILEAASCNIPNTAQTYSLNFTAVPRGPLGYLTVWPAGQSQPYVSTLNSYGGQVVANAAIVPAGSSGEISAFATNDTDLIIDINGYFAAPGQNGLSLYPVAPCRVLDTRLVGNGQPFSGTLAVDVLGSACAPPNPSRAYVFNATVVPSGFLGFLALWPDGGSLPVVSTLNSCDGAVTSNMAIVPAGTGGKIDAYASDLTQLILDISSYFAP